MTTVLIPEAFATNGTITPIAQSTTDGTVSFDLGYSADYSRQLGTDPSAKPVERDKMNYLFNLITSNLIDWQSSAFPQWIAGKAYAVNALVRYSPNVSATPELLYRCLVANTGAQPPNTPATGQWEIVLGTGDLRALIPMPEAQLVTVATDFNTLGGTNSFYELASDAIASGSANSPNSTAGILESKVWTNAGTNFSVQRYTDRTGNVFARGSFNGVWSRWISLVPTQFSTDSSATVNLVQGNSNLTGASVTNGTQFLVQIANANTGAATFSPNSTLTARPVVGMDGQPLQGGELVVGGKALFTFNGTANTWTLNYCTSASQTGARATKPNQLPTLVQVPMPDNGLITAATDFNTLTNGTWEFATDALVSGSPNRPVFGGVNALGGMLESRQWTGSGNTLITQRFSDRSNSVFTRASFNGTFNTWSLLAGSSIAANSLLGNPTGAAAAPVSVTLKDGLDFESGQLGMANITPDNVSTGSIIVNSPGSTSAVAINDPGGNGANLKLLGTSGSPAAPGKFIRSLNGQLQIVNSAYNAVLMTIDDTGNMGALASVIAGTVTATGNLRANNGGAIFGVDGNANGTIWGADGNAFSYVNRGTRYILNANNTNNIKLWWNGAMQLQVDGTNVGQVATTANLSSYWNKSEWLRQDQGSITVTDTGTGGFTVVLPGGGTWFYNYQCTTGTGSLVGTVCGTAAGGTTIGITGPGAQQMHGYAMRIV